MQAKLIGPIGLIKIPLIGLKNMLNEVPIINSPNYANIFGSGLTPVEGGRENS